MWTAAADAKLTLKHRRDDPLLPTSQAPAAKTTIEGASARVQLLVLVLVLEGQAALTFDVAQHQGGEMEHAAAADDSVAGHH
jgi:hypothetical protein